MAAPGPMLPLCQDLTSLDYHHNIHQLSPTQPPTPSLPQAPSTHSLPPVQSLQLDPLNLPNYPSSGHTTVALSTFSTLLSQGRAEGPKALQQDFLTTSIEGHSLSDTFNPSLSSSRLWATERSQREYFTSKKLHIIIYIYIHVVCTEIKSC